MTREDLQNIQVPLDDFVREVAKEAVREAWERHLLTCPMVKERLHHRVQKLELRWAALIGYMLGAGLSGGGMALAAFKILGG